MTGKIIGTGSYLPELVWDNHKLTEWLDTNDEWIRERTGIAQRHISKEMGVSGMALEAAKKAMEDADKAGLGAEDLDAIFVCSVTPDIMVPSIACEIQKELGAVNAFAYDINAACSGFVFAYNMAVAYMETGMIENALIIGSEQLSSMLDWNDRSSCILFGDGAGAVVVTACEQKGAAVMHSDGASGEALQCMTGGKLSMEGQKVFRFALKRVPEVVEEILVKMEMEKDKKFPAYFYEFAELYLNTPDEERWGLEDKLHGFYYNHAMKSGNPFVSAWFELNLDVNNILAAMTARKYKMDVAKVPVGENLVAEALRSSNARDFGLADDLEYFEQLVRINDTVDLVEREKKIDLLKWNWMEDNTFFNYFTIEKIFVFLMKLEMIERWVSLDKDKGNELFRQLIDQLKDEVQIPQEFRK